MKATRTKTLDALVAGGGPAGLIAGFYLARAGYAVQLVGAGPLGGKALRIPLLRNYPGFPAGISGRALMRRMIRQAAAFDLPVSRGTVVSIRSAGSVLRTLLADGTRLQSRAAVVATGTRFNRLGLPGEERLEGRGLFNTVYDGAAAYRGRTVGVVGGGETAAHQALALAAHARRVHLFVRGSKIKGIGPLRNGVESHGKIVFRPNAAVRGLHGGRSLAGVTWGPADGSGEGTRQRLDALFVLIGQKPVLPELGISAAMRESVFVAGDAGGGIERQVSIAAADGLKQAMRCEKFLRGFFGG